MELLGRIEINPQILKGKAIIKGTRLSVQYILGLLASGADFEEILQEYKTLQREDIFACLLFASRALDNQYFAPFSKDVA
ncbi:MAG: DUF433 domain-containing protein [Bacteroidia bacterium]